ncbi:MAG: DUF2066 domain-containing protein [Rhodospirillaceae bacterium]|nr:DUF2066 domain-containing protein [Rhodospirillaceae bacterium]
MPRTLFRNALLIACLTGFGALAAPEAARAQELLTVSGVEVDVTGENASAARNAAITLGQRKAFEKLLAQMVDSASVASLPPASDDQIGAMVSDIEIESERTSAVRYLGVLTYRFYADAVRAYLSGSGARFSATQSPPVLVLPVLIEGASQTLWSDQNGWLAAWSGYTGSGLVPLRVPLGDLEDLAAIDAERALAGDLAALDEVARHYGAADVLVAEARLEPTGGTDGAQGAKVRLTVKRYGPTGLTDTFVDEVSGSSADVSALFTAAVATVDARLQESWKAQAIGTSALSGGTGRLEVTAPLAGLEEWLEIRRRLAQVPSVQSVDMRYLALTEARFDLLYGGDQPSLERALAGRGLSLMATTGNWTLQLSGGFTPAPLPVEPVADEAQLDDVGTDPAIDPGVDATTDPTLQP